MPDPAAGEEPRPLVHASVGRRMIAFFVDLLLIYGVVLVIANLTDRTVGYSPLGFKFGGLGTVLILLGALVYFVAMEAGFGATVGKFAADIRVHGEDGGPVGIPRSIIRNVVRIIDAIPFVVPFLLGAILVWNGRWSQRLGDHLGRTVVLEQHSDRTFVPRIR